MDAIAAHEHDLLEHATAQLSRMPGVRIIGTAGKKAAVLSLPWSRAPASARRRHLPSNQDDVAIRTGHHCAQPVMQHQAAGDRARLVRVLQHHGRSRCSRRMGIRSVQKVFS